MAEDNQTENNNVEETVTEEVKPSRFFWLSFSDVTKPDGEQFLGVAVIKSTDEDAAVAKAEELGIHPGGDVGFLTVPAETEQSRLTEEHINKLLSKADLDRLNLF